MLSHHPVDSEACAAEVHGILMMFVRVTALASIQMLARRYGAGICFLVSDLAATGLGEGLPHTR
jgi:hypothetical protein